MTVQVGPHCYASHSDAGPASCAAFVPVTTLTSGSFISVSCLSANFDGSLNLQRAVVDLGTSYTSTGAFTVDVATPPCTETDWVNAMELIAGPIAALLVFIWSAKKIMDLLNWSRGDAV